MNSASVFASSVLPVPVGPTKRKTPSGRVGSVSPALTSAMRSTMTLTACSWPSTRSSKNAAHRLQIEGPVRVEQGKRKARERRERREHVPGVERRRLALERRVDGRLEQPHRPTGLRDAGEELLRELVRLLQTAWSVETSWSSFSSACAEHPNGLGVGQRDESERPEADCTRGRFATSSSSSPV